MPHWVSTREIDQLLVILDRAARDLERFKYQAAFHELDPALGRRAERALSDIDFARRELVELKRYR